jgi:cytochrome c556
MEAAMRVYVVIAAVTTTLSAAGCASKGDAVGAATGQREPQARMAPQDLEQLMQKIGPTYQSLRKHLQANETDEGSKEAQQLAELFGGVEKFWSQYQRDDAAKWAAEARTHASNAAGAAAAGDPRTSATAAENMGGACKQCHGTYRESDGQGGYRIKPGVLP